MPPVTTQHFGTGGKSSSIEEEEVVVVVVVVFRLDEKECFGGGMATVSMCDCMTKRSLSLSGKKKIHLRQGKYYARAYVVQEKSTIVVV